VSAGGLPGFVDEIGVRRQVGHQAFEVALVHGLEIGRGRLADGLLAVRGGGLALPTQCGDHQQDRGQEPEEDQVLSHGEFLKVGFGTFATWQDRATDMAAVLSI
jgi:hypothetical protein